MDIAALCRRDKSGSLFSFNGVGTQIVITEACTMLEKSMLAVYDPLASAAAIWASDMSSTGLEPELIWSTLAFELSIPTTVQPALTAAIAKGRPT